MHPCASFIVYPSLCILVHHCASLCILVHPCAPFLVQSCASLCTLLVHPCASFLVHPYASSCTLVHTSLFLCRPPRPSSQVLHWPCVAVRQVSRRRQSRFCSGFDAHTTKGKKVLQHIKLHGPTNHSDHTEVQRKRCKERGAKKAVQRKRCKERGARNPSLYKIQTRCGW